MVSLVENYWQSHPQFWISIGSRQVAADKEIYDLFGKLDWLGQTPLGKVIYLDQFIRHFSRVDSSISEEYVLACRQLACGIVNELKLQDYEADDLVWLLMPFKHVGNYDYVLSSVIGWLSSGSSKKLVDYPLLSKFFNDTYRKAYTLDKVASGVMLVESYSDDDKYCPDSICDYYPDRYIADDWFAKLSCEPEVSKLIQLLKDADIGERPIVSLSGGVDSMAMCVLLRLAGIPFVVAHIIYGNREVSLEEFNFIKRYCSKLGIPLYSYKIEHLKRGHIDREFYEDMTRDLRFYMYGSIWLASGSGAGDLGTSLGDQTPTKMPTVLLGHIQDDIVENIWTNFAKGTHLNNLAKMEPVVIENGIKIVRPWLSVKKETIYAISEKLAIPYLKNTTPTWSNRGKFRTKFYEATHEQYGSTVDDTIVKVAESLKQQADLINKLLYEPIYKSWNSETKTIDVSPALQVNLDVNGWHTILTYICHNYLHISKPSIHACRDFTTRMNKLVATGAATKGTYRYDLKGDMHVEIRIDGTGKGMLAFI
jgi:tRNA(Ile)-lysidine synthase TilS/MesJ